jgi:hypothetical protein
MNEKGILEFESYDDEMQNVKTFELSEEEYGLLRKKGGLFDRFDAELGTIISLCEEERIEYENLDKAIELVKKYCKKHLEEKEAKACEMILESLNEASKSGTFWEIDIFLG